MGSDKDFKLAHHSLIDPLVEPDPSDDTGLNSHFRSTFAPRQTPTPTPPTSAGHKNPPSASIRHQHTGSSVETNPYRRSKASSIVAESPTLSNHGKTSSKSRNDYPSPPSSASPRREHHPNHRAEAFGGMNEGRSRRSSNPTTSAAPVNNQGGLTRGHSLRERYPGDNSVRPLDVIRKDTKTAHRAHHLRKKNFQGADCIDRLDRTMFTYHHEGPYDAANLARNKDFKHSPVAAVRDSNEEALRATPRENVMDAVSKHRPLEGVANIPPGIEDRFGRVLDYEEGADLQREGPYGDYRRWPGVEYLPGDLKGKGEPSYSIEKALKDKKHTGDSGIEMTSRRRHKSLGAADASESVPLQNTWDDSRADIGRSNTVAESSGGGLKKRFGSMRRRRAAS